jgi:hypothetical protein
MIIYLAHRLPDGSSGSIVGQASTCDADRLAADGVYLLPMSPLAAVRSYRTRFTLSNRGWWFRFCGTFPRLVPNELSRDPLGLLLVAVNNRHCSELSGLSSPRTSTSSDHPIV